MSILFGLPIRTKHEVLLDSYKSASRRKDSIRILELMTVARKYGVSFTAEVVALA